MLKLSSLLSGPSRRGLLLMSAVLLSGCASVPDLGPMPELKTTKLYMADESLKAPLAQWPTDSWWTAYGDAQLSQLIEEGLAGAPDLAKAEARLKAAEAKAGQARSALLPRLNASGSFNQVYLDPSNAPSFVPDGWGNIGQAGLNFSYEFDFWGKNRASFAAATSSAEASRADAAAAKLVLSASIASAYADLAQLHADRDAAANAVRVRASSFELLSGRRAQGLENEGAVKRSEAGKAAAEAQLASIDEAISLTKNRIAALMGEGPDRALTIGRPTLAAMKEFGLPANLTADLIGRRPDVVAARLRAEAAAQNVTVAKADFYPNVNLSALISTQTLGFTGFPRTGLSYGAAGPAVSLPIFDGGRIANSYRGARAQYDEAVASYDATLTQALKDIADVAASSRALSQRLSKSREALAASEQAYAIAQNRYRGGLATYLDVLTAEDSLIADTKNVAGLETRALSLDVALVRALGGGYQS